jgi:hypothetical protein
LLATRIDGNGNGVRGAWQDGQALLARLIESRPARQDRLVPAHPAAFGHAQAIDAGR